MTKKLFSAVLLVLMLSSMMLLATGCGSETETPADDASAQRIAELEQENAALRAELDKLTADMDREANRLAMAGALEDWTLTADVWTDGNGATVTFTATPAAYVDGQRAALSVRMGDLEAESTNCVWDGTAFTGSVELSAADGYSYFCILTDTDGTQKEIDLNSPENVSDEDLVYLGTSLTSYANLVVEDWDASASALNIKSGYAQAQMPRLTADGSIPGVAKAELVLHLNGEEQSRQEITLAEGEGANSYEAAITGNSFAMPAMEDDDQLDLWLEITLTNGNVVSAVGGSWYSNGSELQLVVG